MVVAIELFKVDLKLRHSTDNSKYCWKACDIKIMQETLRRIYKKKFGLPLFHFRWAYNNNLLAVQLLDYEFDLHRQ